MFIIEILFLSLSTFAIAFFLSSGFKSTILLYVGGGLFILFRIVAPFLEYNPSIILRGIVPLMLIIPILYDGIVLGKENPEEKYFSYLGFGTAIIIIFIILSWWRAGNYADILWGILLIILTFFTFVCGKASNKIHKRIFLILGTLVFFLWISGVFLHPVIWGGDFSLINIMISLKGNISFFVFPAMFFLGNYSKMGLLSNQVIHKKVFLYFVSMFAVSIFIRNPELTPFLNMIPILGDKLPELSSGVTVISIPLVGILIRKQK